MSIVKFRKLGDCNGALVSLESNKNILYEINRVYYIFGTSDGVRRDFHALRILKQVLSYFNACRYTINNKSV